MTQIRELTYPIRLTTAELAYLLGTLHAETLIGGDDRALFPSDPAAREGQWGRGRKQLEADGWLIWDAAAGHHRLNEPLMVIVAALADPEVVLLTSWEGAGQRHGVAHYLSLDLVVEMAIEDGVYQLVALAGVPTMLERLAHVVRFPEGDQPEVVFTLSREEAEQARHNPEARWLESRGLSPETAELFAAALRRPERYGTVTVLRSHEGKVLQMRLVGFLVSANNLGWLAVLEDDQRLRYALAGNGDVTSTLGALVAQVRAAQS
jgi:hypothetical protein